MFTDQLLLPNSSVCDNHASVTGLLVPFTRKDWFIGSGHGTPSSRSDSIANVQCFDGIPGIGGGSHCDVSS